MKKLICLAFIIVSIHGAVGQELKAEYQKFIKKFIENVKKDNKEAVAEMISYPLKRENPIPEIQNKAEFVKRYYEIFDPTLKSEISKSNSAKDWSEMGWRGIMLNQGTVWFDIEGRLISINYKSKFETDLKNKLIAEDKSNLHSSIANFKVPECILETSKFRIRIDDLGNDNYRYASWSVKKTMREEPDLVISNGKWFAEGTGGNHRFVFKKGNYVYEIYIAVLRETTVAPASLMVSQNNKVILSQDAKILAQ